MALRVNLGCGSTPTPGWLNFDNSFTVRVAANPLLRPIARALLLRANREFVELAARGDIRFGRASRIPLADGSVEVLYSSHMLEHLDPDDGRKFLAEARRVLRPGGVLRIVVPDLRKLAEAYIERGDADAFVAQTYMAVDRPRGLKASLRRLLFGFRDHRWMYDGPSLAKLLRENGFQNVVVLRAGETGIEGSGPLDLREREDESVYAEGHAP